MTPAEWWKNFALGMELDVAGTFVFNGAKRLDEVESFYHPADVFEILYNFSVGIERLLKVAVVLIEHDNPTDMEEFEKSLITHDVMGLANRVSAKHDLGLSCIHTEFLSLLSKFYISHRYGRFSQSSIPGIKEEQRMFLEYLHKHLKVEVPAESSYIPVYNTDQILKFIGKVVKKVACSSFSIIGNKAAELNIYTDELRRDSKAVRVFYGERLDFINERIKKKEILLFLINPKSSGDHLNLIRSFQTLDFDPEMAPEYIKALINESHIPMVGDEVDELYAKVTNVGERISMVDIIDNEHLSYE